jgi:hypothetical protein
MQMGMDPVCPRKSQSQLGQQAFVTLVFSFFTISLGQELVMNVEHDVGSIWHEVTVQQEGRSQFGQQAFVNHLSSLFFHKSLWARSL